MRPHGTLHPYIRRHHRFLKTAYNTAIERRNLNNAAAIHYTSVNEMREARTLQLRAPGVVIPLGVALEEYATLPVRGAFRQAHAELKDKRLVVFLGRLTRKKGLDILVEAVALLAGATENVHLVIAGPDDEGYGSVVRACISKARIEDKTTVIGMVSGRQKLQLLADADVWVLPSHSENFGLAVVEAMACRLPVVISDQVDIHPDVSNARAGLVVPCRASAVAAAISRLLGDDALRRAMGTAGGELVASRFSWDAVTDKLLATYQTVLLQSNLRGQTSYEAG
jgi:glycosyltransferase involved in cell wall biosynthesis